MAGAQGGNRAARAHDNAAALRVPRERFDERFERVSLEHEVVARSDGAQRQKPLACRRTHLRFAAEVDGGTEDAPDKHTTRTRASNVQPSRIVRRVAGRLPESNERRQPALLQREDVKVLLHRRCESVDGTDPDSVRWQVGSTEIHATHTPHVGEGSGGSLVSDAAE